MGVASIDLEVGLRVVETAYSCWMSSSTFQSSNELSVVSWGPGACAWPSYQEGTAG